MHTPSFVVAVVFCFLIAMFLGFTVQDKAKQSKIADTDSLVVRLDMRARLISDYQQLTQRKQSLQAQIADIDKRMGWIEGQVQFIDVQTDSLIRMKKESLKVQ